MKTRVIFLSLFILACAQFVNQELYASGESSVGNDIYSNVQNANFDCMTGEEHSALKVRIMKDQMGVASRNCEDNTKKLYDKIDKKFSKVFNANDSVLEIFFNRFDTKDPVKTMNSFITEIANIASLKSIYNKKDFCNKQQIMMKNLLQIEAKYITSFADENITQKISNPKTCK